MRELRGIGPGIETRLRELVETGAIEELAELERELAPASSASAATSGSARSARSRSRGRSVSGRPTSCARRQPPAACGPSRGIGPKTEARLLEALAREAEPRPQRGLLLNRAWELVGGIAAALGGEVGRRRAALARLVRAAGRGLRRGGPVARCWSASPRCRRSSRWSSRQSGARSGVTVDGVPVELVVAAPRAFGTALVRATGSPAYVAALEPLPEAPDEAAVYRALGVPWCPPELREEPFRGEPPDLVELGEIRGDLHCHTTWSDGRASVEEMGRAARERGYDYVAICDHTPAVGAVRGLTADDVRRQAEEIAAANELLAPFRVLRGIECDILPDGRLDLPDDVLADLDWVQASVHGGQRMPRAGDDRSASRRRCATPT